jgi:hypothetical protein
MTRCARLFRAQPVRKRKLVDEMGSDWGVSIRRACRATTHKILTMVLVRFHLKGSPGNQHVEKQDCEPIGIVFFVNSSGGLLLGDPCRHNVVGILCRRSDKIKL